MFLVSVIFCNSIVAASFVLAEFLIKTASLSCHVFTKLSFSEVDQPLREVLVAALEVEDHRHAFLEAVGDLLRVVEAARQHEVDAGGAATAPTARDALDAAQTARLGRGPQDACACRGRRRLGVGPVVEFLAAATPRREPAHVRPVGVGALELLVGEVAVLVPILFLGDPEVDEGLAPDVGEAHGAECYCGRRLPNIDEPTRM